MVNTLQKFGVPLGGQGRGGLLQPKLAYRFRVLVNNFGPLAGGIDFTQQVISVSKPTLNTDIVEIHSYNSRAYTAGKHEWQDITLTLRDDVTNSISRLVGHQQTKQMNHFEQSSFLAGVNFKFQMQIEVMDGGNETVLEHWDVEGCFITSANWSDLDYTDTSGVQTIELTIRYDNATQADGLMSENPQSISGSAIG